MMTRNSKLCRSWLENYHPQDPVMKDLRQDILSDPTWPVSGFHYRSQALDHLHRRRACQEARFAMIRMWKIAQRRRFHD